MGSGTLRYTPSVCFETFSFPQNLLNELVAELEQIGGQYHKFRKHIMIKIQLGLTKTYNLFHTKELTVEDVIKNSKQNEDVCENAYQDILKLRQLHKLMDNTVLKAYNWEDINLAHDFYEVDYLPENDRIRFTISPEARKEILKRLLLLNHQIYKEEITQGLHDKKKISKKKNKGHSTQGSLVFVETDSVGKIKD